jgi:hypothetical protein
VDPVWLSSDAGRALTTFCMFIAVNLLVQFLKSFIRISLRLLGA